MNTHGTKSAETQNQPAANAAAPKQNSGENAFQLEDHRPEAIAQRKLQTDINNSPRMDQLRTVQAMANNSPQSKQLKAYQTMADAHNSRTVQRKEDLKTSLSGESYPMPTNTNKTGLPDNLKSGVENLSGHSLDDVKVHYNSDKPAQLQAHAYAQGTDIHLASGQEQHLPHEAWHVVQQKQGRVKPTIQMKGKINVNDDEGLEKEADVMGGKATQFKINNPGEKSLITQNGQESLVQRLKWSEVHTGTTKAVGISEQQMPKGVGAVEGDGATVDRNVWAGQAKKGRSGFLWHNESTLEIQYDINSMQQYKIIDPTVVFYTAVRDSAIEPIKQHGINPNFGNADKPDGPTQYNVRGFNYFGKDKKVPTIYGSYLAPEPWRIISFQLPEDTLIERDPEIPNGLRTAYHIKASDIKF